MLKNVLLGLYTLILALTIVALATDRLAWVSVEERNSGNTEEILKKAIEMHKPEVLEMGDIKILHVPTSKMSGRNWSVNHAFFIYDEGKLQRTRLPIIHPSERENNFRSHGRTAYTSRWWEQCQH